jgi:4-hydroxy-tetrahydrodipicolinate reductase
MTTTGSGNRIRVVVAGPDGHVGRAMVAGFAADPTLELVGGIRRGDDDVREKLSAADVLVDFTSAAAAPALMVAALEAGVRPVSGTSGLADDDLAAVDAAARERKLPAVWAPNFSPAAVLLAQLAELAAKYMDAAEIIEGHPSRKADAPSGTALALARGIRQARGTDFTDRPVADEILPGIRGAAAGGVRLHSVRHPVSTMISWHEVIFTSEDGVLRLRYDEAGGREPVESVIRAVNGVMTDERIGLIRGHDAVLGLGGDRRR